MNKPITTMEQVMPIKPRLPNKTELEAIRRYQNGEQLMFSTGIHDHITYGYGQLDDFGFWEFPMPYAYLNSAHKNLVDEYELEWRLRASDRD